MLVSYRADRRGVERLNQVRRLRTSGTEAELRLWSLLRARQINGVKFRRQHQFGPYVLDFFAPSHRVVVEADGSQHLTHTGRDRDAARSAFLSGWGIRVLRFTNDEILADPALVVDVIASELRRPHPDPLPGGEGNRTAVAGGP